MATKKIPAQYIQGRARLLSGILPKSVWADIAYNLALRIDGEDRADGALRVLLEEAALVRPDGRWAQKLAAIERRIETRRGGDGNVDRHYQAGYAYACGYHD